MVEFNGFAGSMKAPPCCGWPALPYDYDLAFGHHRIALGRIDDSGYIDICTIDYGQVEFLFGVSENVVYNIVGDEVYVIRFLAHEIVDGAVLLGSQLF